jgi:hypothetical protein
MKVRNNAPRLIVLGGKLNLVPGLNQVADAIWLQATANPGPVLLHFFESKTLEVLEAPKGAEAPAAPAAPAPSKAAEKAAARPVDDGKTGDENLSGLSAEEAVSFVADCLDRETLEAWKKGEKRKTVLAAIDEQLELTKV